MAMLSFRVFYVGSAVNPADVRVDVLVDGSDMKLTARLASSGMGISRVTFSESNGMVRLTVYAVPKAFFNHGDFTASYTAAGDIVQVRNNDLILWENGAEISTAAARLFAAKNPFVGDMPSNSRIAAILGIADQFGSFSNELETAAAPYGWTLQLENPLADAYVSTAQEMMTADACVILAMIENLDSVTWVYETETGTQEYTITAQKATAAIGRDIKKAADSATDVQTLLQDLGLEESDAWDISE